MFEVNSYVLSIAVKNQKLILDVPMDFSFETNCISTSGHCIISNAKILIKIIPTRSQSSHINYKSIFKTELFLHILKYFVIKY